MSSYLISTQVGALGIISLALALVTLIAQRESSSTDVQVYYHQAMAYEVVASCLALLAVLCVQLLWPVQFLVHRLGFGGDNQVFKLCLVAVHLLWLLLNLCGLTHFITVTFGFVQQEQRERLRERYTVNVALPRELEGRLRQQAYMSASQGLTGKSGQTEPQVLFGFNTSSQAAAVEMQANFKHPVTLKEVHMAPVLWVIRRWKKRSSRHPAAKHTDQDWPDGERTRLCFVPMVDTRLHGTITWCRRDGGVPLTRLERFVLRWAFRFRRAANEE